MVLKDIMAISGSRFVQVHCQGKNAIIVEHLETKIRAAHSALPE